MKASIAHGIRPSALLLGKDSHKPWNATDILLAKSYQRFLNELCQQCGLPKYLCHNEDNRIQFRVVEDQCESQAAAERRQDDKSKSDTKSFGVKVYSEPYLLDDAIQAGLEFSDFRRPYLMEQAKKMGLLPDDFVVPPA